MVTWTIINNECEFECVCVCVCVCVCASAFWSPYGDKAEMQRGRMALRGPQGYFNWHCDQTTNPKHSIPTEAAMRQNTHHTHTHTHTHTKTHTHKQYINPLIHSLKYILSVHT